MEGLLGCKAALARGNGASHLRAQSIPGPLKPGPRHPAWGQNRDSMGSPLFPQAHTSSPCRDLGEGTRGLANMARGMDKDPWTLSGPTSSPHAQVMVHTATAGQTPPAPTMGVLR